jgi:hypothetical protein
MANLMTSFRKLCSKEISSCTALKVNTDDSHMEELYDPNFKLMFYSKSSENKHVTIKQIFHYTSN